MDTSINTAVPEADHGASRGFVLPRSDVLADQIAPHGPAPLVVINTPRRQGLTTILTEVAILVAARTPAFGTEPRRVLVASNARLSVITKALVHCFDRSYPRPEKYGGDPLKLEFESGGKIVFASYAGDIGEDGMQMEAPSDSFYFTEASVPAEKFTHVIVDGYSWCPPHVVDWIAMASTPTARKLYAGGLVS
jgi:hypothetical protein